MSNTMIIGIDHEDQILLGVAEGQLAAHAVEVEALAVGLPDVVAVAHAFDGRAGNVGIDQLGGGGAGTQVNGSGMAVAAVFQ